MISKGTYIVNLPILNLITYLIMEKIIVYALRNLMGLQGSLGRTFLGRAALLMLCFGLFLIQPRKMSARISMLLTRIRTPAEER